MVLQVAKQSSFLKARKERPEKRKGVGSFFLLKASPQCSKTSQYPTFQTYLTVSLSNYAIAQLFRMLNKMESEAWGYSLVVEYA